jgi:hypothetical protein
MSEVDNAGVEDSAEAGKRRLSFNSLLVPLADLLLLPVCAVCRTRIGSHGLFCGACFAKIEFIAPPLCDRPGVPLPYDTGEGRQLSAAAIVEPPVYDRARVITRYSGTMRELIQQISRPPRGPATLRPLAGEGRGRAPRRCRLHRAGAALLMAALVAALQSIGHALPRGRAARSCPGRLPCATARAEDRELGRPFADQ